MGALFFLQHSELPSTIPIQLTVTEMQNFALLAVPLFILAGNFLNNSGITHNLLKLATVLTGRMQGGLAQTSIAPAGVISYGSLMSPIIPPGIGFILYDEFALGARQRAAR